MLAGIEHEVPIRWAGSSFSPASARTAPWRYGSPVQRPRASGIGDGYLKTVVNEFLATRASGRRRAWRRSSCGRCREIRELVIDGNAADRIALDKPRAQPSTRARRRRQLRPRRCANRRRNAVAAARSAPTLRREPPPGDPGGPAAGDGNVQIEVSDSGPRSDGVAREYLRAFFTTRAKGTGWAWHFVLQIVARSRRRRERDERPTAGASFHSTAHPCSSIHYQPLGCMSTSIIHRPTLSRITSVRGPPRDRRRGWLAIRTELAGAARPRHEDRTPRPSTDAEGEAVPARTTSRRISPLGRATVALDPDTTMSRAAPMRRCSRRGAAIGRSRRSGAAAPQNTPSRGAPARSPRRGAGRMGLPACLNTGSRRGARRLGAGARECARWTYTTQRHAAVFGSGRDCSNLSSHQYPRTTRHRIVRDVGNRAVPRATRELPAAAGPWRLRLWRRGLSGLFLPAGERFRPDIVSWSAGFDAHAPTRWPTCWSPSADSRDVHSLASSRSAFALQAGTAVAVSTPGRRAQSGALLEVDDRRAREDFPPGVGATSAAVISETQAALPARAAKPVPEAEAGAARRGARDRRARQANLYPPAAALISSSPGSRSGLMCACSSVARRPSAERRLHRRDIRARGDVSFIDFPPCFLCWWFHGRRRWSAGNVAGGRACEAALAGSGRGLSLACRPPSISATRRRAALPVVQGTTFCSSAGLRRQACVLPPHRASPLRSRPFSLRCVHAHFEVRLREVGSLRCRVTTWHDAAAMTVITKPRRCDHWLGWAHNRAGAAWHPFESRAVLALELVIPFADLRTGPGPAPAAGRRCCSPCFFRS